MSKPNKTSVYHQDSQKHNSCLIVYPSNSAFLWKYLLLPGVSKWKRASGNWPPFSLLNFHLFNNLRPTKYSCRHSVYSNSCFNQTTHAEQAQAFLQSLSPVWNPKLKCTNLRLKGMRDDIDLIFLSLVAQVTTLAAVWLSCKFVIFKS